MLVRSFGDVSLSMVTRTRIGISSLTTNSSWKQVLTTTQPAITAMFQHGGYDVNFRASAKDKEDRLLLPGYGRPLDYAPVEKDIYGVESRSMFPTALDDRDIENGFTEYVRYLSPDCSR